MKGTRVLRAGDTVDVEIKEALEAFDALNVMGPNMRSAFLMSGAHTTWPWKIIWTTCTMWESCPSLTVQLFDQLTCAIVSQLFAEAVVAP